MDFVDHLDPAAFDANTPAAIDFYRHVNGGWLEANPVPSEYPAWGAALEVHVRNEKILHELLKEAAKIPGPVGSPSRMVGDFFASGMDEAAIANVGIAPLQPFLDDISSLGNVTDLRGLLTRFKRAGVGGFHSLGISPDFEDADRYMVYLGQGGLGLPDRDYYVRDDERSIALVGLYTQHIAAQLGNLGVGGESEAAAIVDVEKRLADASLPTDTLRKAEVRYNRHVISDLDELMPDFGLESYVRELGVTSESVNVDNADFFVTLEDVLAETPMETIQSYLHWHLIRNFAPSLSSEFEDEAFDFYNRKLGGQQEPRERWTRILGAATSDIGEQVARLYVNAAFSPEAKERCEHLVDGLLDAMGRSIRQLEWMTDATKAAALEKLDGFGYKIGYPDDWKEFEGLEIDPASYVGNRINCAIFEYDREMGRLDETVDKGEWAMPAHMVNAYYHPMLNEVVFPAGILQPPFFYADADDAVNFGAIGSVIGHEITHGFDDNGSQFDATGSRRNWWTDVDRSEFEKRAEGLVAQFDEFVVAEGQKVNGRLTLGENIADLGGLKIAFDALLMTLDGSEAGLGGLTVPQRFFLSYGTIWRMNYTDEYLRMLANVDVHSPNPFRVNGPISNFPPFAEAFGVEEGAPMCRSGDDLVSIW